MCQLHETFLSTITGGLHKNKNKRKKVPCFLGVVRNLGLNTALPCCSHCPKKTHKKIIAHSALHDSHHWALAKPPGAALGCVAILASDRVRAAGCVTQSDQNRFFHYASTEKQSCDHHLCSKCTLEYTEPLGLLLKPQSHITML